MNSQEMPRANAAAASSPQQQEQLKQQIEQLRRKALLLTASTSSASADRASSRKRALVALGQGDQRWDGSESESDYVDDARAEDGDDEFASIGGPQAFKFPKLVHPVLRRQRAMVSEIDEYPAMPLLRRTPALVRALTKPSRVLSCARSRSVTQRFVQ
uniref:Uncharacterized protein n=1 Tax=Globisporangium ultimum (strain ATCC 200006 / CBS 805.95 / DAOM BR144) TaxID=431595 RepID=K3WTK7_GLOUD